MEALRKKDQNLKFTLVMVQDSRPYYEMDADWDVAYNAAVESDQDVIMFLRELTTGMFIKIYDGMAQGRRRMN